MTLRLTVCCDGSFDAGRMPCRGQMSEDPPADNLRAKATAAGWHLTTTADLCPSHARAAKETPAP